MATKTDTMVIVPGGGINVRAWVEDAMKQGWSFDGDLDQQIQSGEPVTLTR